MHLLEKKEESENAAFTALKEDLSERTNIICKQSHLIIQTAVINQMFYSSQKSQTFFQRADGDSLQSPDNSIVKISSLF